MVLSKSSTDWRAQLRRRFTLEQLVEVQAGMPDREAWQCVESYLVHRCLGLIVLGTHGDVPSVGSAGSTASVVSVRLDPGSAASEFCVPLDRGIYGLGG